jgi:hypothetical protein
MTSTSRAKRADKALGFGATSGDLVVSIKGLAGATGAATTGSGGKSLPDKASAGGKILAALSVFAGSGSTTFSVTVGKSGMLGKSANDGMAGMEGNDGSSGIAGNSGMGGKFKSLKLGKDWTKSWPVLFIFSNLSAK